MLDIIRFPYSPTATAQAAAFWITIYDSPLHWQYLMYLLYLGDRKHLIEHGVPITGDSYICNGDKPVLLATIELLHHSSCSPLLEYPLHLWQHFFSQPNSKGEVIILTDPGIGDLSESMEDVIYQLFDEVRNYSLEELEQYCSRLSECQDKGYFRRIEIYNILVEHGYTIDELIDVKRQANLDCRLDQLQAQTN